MRDGKNINKFALSREKLLISGYGNGRLRPVFYGVRRPLLLARDEVLGVRSEMIVDTSALFAYKRSARLLGIKSLGEVFVGFV